MLALHTWQASVTASTQTMTLDYALSYVGGWSWPSLDLYSTRYVTDSPGYPDRWVSAWTPLAPGATFTFTRLERQLAFRLGWTPTLIETLGAVPPSTGYPPDRLFADGFLSEATFAAAYSDTHRYAHSISTEEGRSLTLRLRYAGAATGSDYDLWRARAAWAEFTRVPVHPPRGAGDAALRRHRPRLAGRLAPLLAGRHPPHRPAGAHHAAVLLAVGPAARLPGRPLRGQRHRSRATVELRFPIFAPELGHSTWPLFLRRVHAAVFADVGEAFVQGTERGYAGPDFHWERLRVGAGAELRLETALAYWILTDVRLGVARGPRQAAGRRRPHGGSLRRLAVVRGAGAELLIQGRRRSHPRLAGPFAW